MNIRISILLLAVLLLLFGLGISTKMRRNETPDVQVAGGLIYDAGAIPGDRPLMHTFQLTNPHSFPVGLSIVTTGCECTTATVSAPTIPPHGQADVIVRVTLEDTKDISSGLCFAVTHGDKRVENWLLITGHVGRVASSNKKR
ncbi:MAG: DUF1573 domain-containing protein [Capsulimonas sp.]|uniref:DUF1573 domain-containing protein n=1 Tax=Capsulimonas sp. TaxID=2494211 RepID=UPI0032670EB7